MPRVEYLTFLMIVAAYLIDVMDVGLARERGGWSLGLVGVALLAAAVQMFGWHNGAGFIAVVLAVLLIGIVRVATMWLNAGGWKVVGFVLLTFSLWLAKHAGAGFRWLARAVADAVRSVFFPPLPARPAPAPRVEPVPEPVLPVSTRVVALPSGDLWGLVKPAGNEVGTPETGPGTYEELIAEVVERDGKGFEAAARLAKAMGWSTSRTSFYRDVRDAREGQPA